MKKIRLLLTGILCISLLVGMDYGKIYGNSKSDVDICRELEILIGDGDGVTETYLNKETTRLQALIMFLRLRGLDDEALAFKGEANFTDANRVSWQGGKNILSYAYYNPQLGWVGYYDGSFKPNDSITVKQYYKVMLEALGYEYDVDYTWDEVLTFADGKGLSKLGIEGILKNRDIATATIEALKAESRSGKIFINQLVDLGIISTYSAYMAGLIDVDGDLAELKVYSDDADHTITADGKSMTKIIFQLEKIDGSILEVDGVINFHTTLGKLSIDETVFEAGQASVQLTAVDADELKSAFVHGTLTKMKNQDMYEGMTNSIQINFDPYEIVDEELGYNEVAFVTADQGDRVKVTYTNPIDVEVYKKELLRDNHSETWSELRDAGTNAGLRIDGVDIKVLDILQGDDYTLMYVLNTDYIDKLAPKYGVDITRITNGWTYNKRHYLAENEEHILTFPKNVGNIILANVDGIMFRMDDYTRPMVQTVEGVDSKTIVITFSESIAEETAEPKVRGKEFLTGDTVFTDNMEGHYGGLTINGKKLYITFSDNGATREEIEFASKNDILLVNNIEVGYYNYYDTIDTRNQVTITMDNYNLLSEGSHEIYLKRFSDWAGVVDRNNIMLPVTKRFMITKDRDVPTADVVVESPEQWKIIFSEKVYFLDTYKEVMSITYGDDDIILNLDTNGTVDFKEDDYKIIDLTGDGDQTVLMVEFLKDWTEYFNTSTSTKGYWSSAINPFKIKFEKEMIKDENNNYMEEQEKEVRLSIDSMSPILLNAVDQSTVNPDIEPGEEVELSFNEPVQVRDEGGFASTIRMTPSEQQTRLASKIQYDERNVPQPTFMFIKGDILIDGNIKLGSIAADDKTFVVVPERVLDSGHWTLYIQNLTDDIGNAYSTANVDVYVPGEVDNNRQVSIMWAAFDNTNQNAPNKVYDAVYVKFTDEMYSYGASGVSRVENYYINDKPLPEQSRVLAGIKGITNEWDGITIMIPAEFYIDSTAGGDTDATFTFRLADNIKALNGKRLNGGTEVLLADSDGQSVDGNDLSYEAVYLDQTSNGLLNGEMIKEVRAEDSSRNGRIDTLFVTLDKPSAMTGLETLFVGEIQFNIATTNNTSTHIFSTDPSYKGISGTDTKGHSLTSREKYIILGKGKIIDAAGPAITKMTYNGTTEIELVFSESIDDTSVSVGDFILSGSGITTETIVSIDTGAKENDNRITLTLSSDPLLASGEVMKLALVKNEISDLNGVLSTQVNDLIYSR